jgi:hypothetical protein
MMTRHEILSEITRLQIEKDEVLGDLASHHMDLSDTFTQAKNRYNEEIRALNDMLKDMPLEPRK